MQQAVAPDYPVDSLTVAAFSLVLHKPCTIIEKPLCIYMPQDTCTVMYPCINSSSAANVS